MPTSDPNKTIFGAAYDTEFANISTAIAAKVDLTANNPGVVTIGGINVNGTTVPTNGLYLPSANTVGISANTTLLVTLATGGIVVNAAIGGAQGVGTINSTAGYYINGLVPQVSNNTFTPGNISTGETYITPVYNLPANSLAVGNTFLIVIHGSCSSSHAGDTTTFTVRIGLNGSIADPSAFSNGWTFPSAVGTNSFTVRFYLTVSVIGASAKFNGTIDLLNGTVVVGGMISGAAQVINNGNANTFNSTTALKLGMSLVSSVGTTSYQINATEIYRTF